MNKKTVEPKAANEAANVQPNPTANEAKKPVLYPLNNTVVFYMPDTNTLGKLVKAKKGVELTSKYMTVQDWEKRMGEPLYCFYSGMKDSTNGEGNHYQIARLINAKGEPFICAQNGLVESLVHLEVGQGVEITCVDVVDKEFSDGQMGRVAYFKVIALEVNMFDHMKSEKK